MMRRILLGLLFAAGLGGVVGETNAQITKVATSTLGEQDGNNTTTCTSGAIDTTTAELLIHVASHGGLEDLGGTFSDTETGNSWTEITRVYHADSQVGVIMHYSVPVDTGASHSATYVPGGARTFKRCGLIAVSGNFNVANALHDFAAAVSSVDGTTIDAGTIDTTLPSIIVQWSVNHFAEALTPAGSFSGGDEDLDSSGRHIQSRIEATSVSGFDPAATAGSAIGWATIAASFAEDDTSSQEQHSFRWGVDDGNEASHSFEAALNTDISISDNQSRLLRVLINATDDPASFAYTLRYQKNGVGGYVAVPVGATQKVTPVIEAGDATESGNNTATASWAVSHPTASSGDLLIFCIAWDDSTATTDVTEPAGPNSEVLTEINATPATDSATETRSKCWYTVATGSWSASTLTFTPAASEQWTAAVIKVLAGEFDAGTPIGSSGTNSSTGTTTTVLNAAFTAGGSDGSGKVLTFASVDVNPQTVASGWTEIANEDRGAVSGAIYSRNTAASDSESISAGTVATITTESFASVSFIVRAPTISNEVYITTSANIAAGGEATTARLTAPSGKTTSDFDTGRRWDDENGSDSLDITTDNYAEFEWLPFIASSAADGDFFDFRVYAGAGALNTYTDTPRWTIPSAGGGSIAPHALHYFKLRAQFLPEDPANDLLFLDWPAVSNGP